MIQLAVRAIIQKDEKYLLVRNKGNDFWCLPGGGVEAGEPVVQALERELVEELGVRPVVGQLVYVYQFMASETLERVEFLFLVDNPEAYEGVHGIRTSHARAELSELGFHPLDEAKVLPSFLLTELPALLKNNAPSVLPRFRHNTD